MTVYSTPTEPGENVLDSRDLTFREQDIEVEFGLDGVSFGGPAEFTAHIRETDEDVADEYERLYAVNEEGRSTFGAGDWDASGIILIEDGYFEDYARDLADDIGAIDSEYDWPLTHIDWPAAAASLQQDYSAIDYGGYTYWGRA